MEQQKPQNLIFTNEAIKNLVVPLIFEQFLMMSIGACDQVMVGSIIIDGQEGIAIASVSLIDQLAQLFIQLFAAFATGGAVVASQYLGQKDSTNASKAAKQLLNLCTFVGLLFVVICIPLKIKIVDFLFGGSDILVQQKSVQYFVWILLSIPFLAIYNSCAALCRSMGNSKISLKVSFAMNLINIVGNALLIYVIKLDVNGAGIATLSSRIVAAIIMIIILKQKNKWQIYLEKLWKIEIDFAMISRIFKVAIPNAIENSLFHVGKTLVYSFMSGFGTAAISANGVANTICNISNIPGNAICFASVTVVGQCIGADEKNQAKHNAKKLLKLAYLGMGLMAIFVGIISPLAVKAFNVGLDAQKLAMYVVWSCMVCNMLFWPMSFVMPSCLRGAGDAKYTMFVSNITMWIFRVFASYIMSQWLLARFDSSFALFGIWFGMFLDWIVRGLLFGWRFHKNKWLEKKVI